MNWNNYNKDTMLIKRLYPNVNWVRKKYWHLIILIQHLTKIMSALCRLSIIGQIDGTQSVAVNYNLDLFYNPSHFMCPPLKCQSSFILYHCPALHMFWRYQIDISYMIIDQPPDVFIFSIFLPVDKIVLQCYRVWPKRFWRAVLEILLQLLLIVHLAHINWLSS